MANIVEKELSYQIVGCFNEVFNELGYGFNESIYSRALGVSLTRHGLLVEREIPVTVVFQGVEVGLQRIDPLVERRVIIEVKAGERLAHAAILQTRSYLATRQLQLGLVLHFGPTPRFERVLFKPRPSP